MLLKLPDPALAAAIAAAMSLVVTMLTLASQGLLQRGRHAQEVKLLRIKTQLENRQKEFEYELREKLENAKREADKWRSVEIHQSKTKELLPGIESSFKALASIEPGSVDPDVLMGETTKVLKVFSSYLEHLNVNGVEYGSYSEDLKATLETLEDSVASVFINLSFSTKGIPPASMTESLASLSTNTAKAIALIHDTVRVKPPNRDA